MASAGKIQAAMERVCRQMRVAARLEIYPDIYSTLASELESEPGIVIVAGTGSCAMAQDEGGHLRRCGGWGALLGDEASGYAMGLAVLRRILAEHDGLLAPSVLGRTALRKLGFRTPDAICQWAHAAGKKDIAALAPLVFVCAKNNDAAAIALLLDAVKELLNYVLHLYCWLRDRGVGSTRVILTGGLFEHHAEFSGLLSKEIERSVGPLPVKVCRGRKGLGALRLALDAVKPGKIVSHAKKSAASRSLDTLDSHAIVSAILQQDLQVPRVVFSQTPALTEAVELIVRALQRNGRVFYVGAGTSGRLAALDASELGPTFSLAQGVFEVLLAGGPRALTIPVEAAEDDEQAAQDQLRAKNLGGSDIVVGISASGSTPFVIGALRYAKKSGAKTIGIACNSNPVLQKHSDIVIVADVGAEIVRGSTRMKAGTATKLILNTLSTAAMIRLGKVYDQWMIDVIPNNKKLRDRAVGIVCALTGQSNAAAQKVLDGASGNPKTAIVMAKKNISKKSAERVLAGAQGNLRVALRDKR